MKHITSSEKAIVDSIVSRNKSFGEMWKEEKWDLPHLAKYGFDWNKMQSKVVYNAEVITYGVYLYENNGLFYYINEDEVIQVVPTKVLCPAPDGYYYDSKGQVIDSELIYDLYPNEMSGEADDCSCYVYYCQNLEEKKDRS